MRQSEILEVKALSLILSRTEKTSLELIRLILIAIDLSVLLTLY